VNFTSCPLDTSDKILYTLKTFDDLTTKRFTTYNLATWTGFTAVGYGHANPILPASRPRQARSTTGTGLIDFTDSGQLASLRTFSYGCATPAGRSRASDAVACNVTITATALQFLDGGGVGSFQYEGTFSYEPVPSGVGRFVAMEDGDWVSVSGTVTVAPGANPFYVFNYTFSATGADSSPVFLYLDDVVYSALCIGCGP